MSTNYISQITATDGVTYDVQEGVTTRIFRATCTTAASTAAKVATLDDATGYSLTAGVRIAVTFTYGNTATSPTLNVNSGGAKNIYYRIDASTYEIVDELCVWGNNETVIFTYNGTIWTMMGSSLALYNAYNKAASHAHGNITNGGDITATAPTIANGDQIIINDNSASKITNGPTFDGSTTTKALTQKGTWETFSKFSGSYNDLSDKPTIPTNTDEKLAISEANLNVGYNVLLGNGESAQTRQGDGGLWYTRISGTPAIANLCVGNGTHSSGNLTLGDGTSHSTTVTTDTQTANRTITLPDKTGTVALTSDIPDVSGFVTTDEKVKQENTTSSNTYRVLLSGDANDTTSTTTSYKSTNLKFTPSTGNLQTTQLNGVTVGSSPKFTDTNTISAWYGTCSSNSTTETKIVSCSGFTLSTGALIAVHFSSGNQLGGAIKLNINGTGDKSIYYKGAAVSSNNMLYWQNDETVLFSYDGTNYQYVSNSFVVNEVGASSSVSILLSTDSGNKYKSSNLSFSTGISSNSPRLIIGSSSTSTGTLTLGNNGKQISITPTTLSASREITLPDKAGTVALTSDIIDEKVKQENTTSSSTYRVLLSGDANDTTSTTTSYKSTNLKFTPSTGNLQTTQLNGVTVGSSPKFTDSEVSTLTLASGSTTGTSLSFGSKYTLTAGSKTVSFTMPSSPTVTQANINASSSSLEFEFTGDIYTTNNLDDETDALYTEIVATQTSMENITTVVNSKPNITITRW